MKWINAPRALALATATVLCTLCIGCNVSFAQELDSTKDASQSQASEVKNTYPLRDPASKEPSGGGVSLQTGVGELRLSGTLSLLGVYGSDRAFVPWSPLFMLPPSAVGNDNSTFESHARQSSLQFVFSAPEVSGWQSGAFGKFYFTNSSLTSDSYGLMPVVAFGETRNEYVRFAAGLQPDLFAPRDPVVVPMTLMGGTGNAGTFRGQLRAEGTWRPSEVAQATLQTALSDPISTVLLDSTRRTTESDGIPNFEARLALGLGKTSSLAGKRNERTFEAGVGGFWGRIRSSQVLYSLDDIDPNVPVRSTMNISGASVDAKLNLTNNFGLTAEGYLGKGLGTYAGSVFQTFNPNSFESIEGQGGFIESFIYINDYVHLHVGYGIDTAKEEDLFKMPAGITSNSAYFTSLFWDITPMIQYSVQVDYRETDYVALADNSGWIVYNQCALRF